MHARTPPGVRGRPLPPGTAVGYAALFEGGERDADVIAHAECPVAVISFSELSLLATTGHDGAAKLLTALARCMCGHGGEITPPPGRSA